MYPVKFLLSNGKHQQKKIADQQVTYFVRLWLDWLFGGDSLMQLPPHFKVVLTLLGPTLEVKVHLDELHQTRHPTGLVAWHWLSLRPRKKP